MLNRTETLQTFVDALEAAIRARQSDTPSAAPLVDKVFSALAEPGDANTDHQPARLDICNHLDTAYDLGRSGPDPIATLTDAFAAIEPSFTWHRRLQAAEAGDDFFNGHANAMIVGRDGLERRQDVLIGVSLVAPGVSYPRHRHPPEELYTVIAPGKWMQNDQGLLPRETGDLVHNPSNTWHAMAAGQTPLLAVWSLWTGD